MNNLTKSFSMFDLISYFMGFIARTEESRNNYSTHVNIAQLRGVSL